MAAVIANATTGIVAAAAQSSVNHALETAAVVIDAVLNASISLALFGSMFTRLQHVSSAGTLF